MKIRINPIHWGLGSYSLEGRTFTHEPQEVSEKEGEALLQLRRNGVATFAVAEEEVPAAPIFGKEAEEVDETPPAPKRRGNAKNTDEGDDPE